MCVCEREREGGSEGGGGGERGKDSEREIRRGQKDAGEARTKRATGRVSAYERERARDREREEKTRTE